MKKIGKATEINQRVKEARKRAGLTQKEFSGRIGISRSFLSEIEGDKVKPSIETLVGIILHFEVDPRWLLVGKGAERHEGLVAAESASPYGSGVDRSSACPVWPLLDARVVAGAPCRISEKEIVGRLPVWGFPPEKQGYCFYVHDDGMAPLIQEGAWVGVTPISAPYQKLEGKVVAAWLSKGGMTVRRFHFDQKHIILEPENKAYPNLYLEKSERVILFFVNGWGQNQGD